MDPYIGEIRIVGFTFAPVGWALCNGSLLSINDYDTLFALIGTTYGGDGQSTFGLPNLIGRVPVHAGTGTASTYTLGQTGGTPTVTLNSNQIPSHTHPIAVSSGQGSVAGPADSYFAGSTVNIYAAPAATSAMGSFVAPQGGSQPHENTQPYQVLNYIIATEGIYPSRN